MEIRFLASIRVSDQFDDLGASCSKNKCKKQGEVAVITTYTMAASYAQVVLQSASLGHMRFYSLRQSAESLPTVCEIWILCVSSWRGGGAKVR